MATSQLTYRRLSPVCGIDLDDAMKVGGDRKNNASRGEVGLLASE